MELMDRPSPSPHDRARQWALATTLGIGIGIIPKDSAVVYLLLLAALILPTRWLCLAASSATFWLFGILADPLLHKLGALLLTSAGWVPFWARCAELPGIPWTRFNNTVALGAIVTSLLLVIPVYCLMLPLYQRWAPRLMRWSEQSVWSRWLIGQRPLPPTEPAA
jgi:uncharacterized protein (TIGR03546 family)